MLGFLQVIARGMRATCVRCQTPMHNLNRCMLPVERLRPGHEPSVAYVSFPKIPSGFGFGVARQKHHTIAVMLAVLQSIGMFKPAVPVILPEPHFILMRPPVAAPTVSANRDKSRAGLRASRSPSLALGFPV
jgi:hypothetical protein